METRNENLSTFQLVYKCPLFDVLIQIQERNMVNLMFNFKFKAVWIHVSKKTNFSIIFFSMNAINKVLFKWKFLALILSTEIKDNIYIPLHIEACFPKILQGCPFPIEISFEC